MIYCENIDPKAELHIVVQGFRVVGRFPSVTEANNRAASLASQSPLEMWVMHLIRKHEGFDGSICFTTTYGDKHDYTQAESEQSP